MDTGAFLRLIQPDLMTYLVKIYQIGRQSFKTICTWELLGANVLKFMLMSQSWEGKALSSEAKFKPPKMLLLFSIILFSFEACIS